MEALRIGKPEFLPRQKDSHKGTYGTALIVCGSYGMAGAAIMAISAALKSGVGIVKAAVPESVYPIITAAVPEAVCIPLPDFKKGIKFCKKTKYEISKALKTCTAVLFGCGCAETKHSAKLLKFILKNSQAPVTVDAGGINLLAEHINYCGLAKSPLIITPHIGEMARLVKKSTAEISESPANTALEFSQKYNTITVLKSSNTVVAQNRNVYINTIGNPGMATGGSGDVLAGITVGLLAQKGDVLTSVLNAVYVHSAAGDSAACDLGEISLTPTDIINRLPQIYKSLTKQ